MPVEAKQQPYAVRAEDGTLVAGATTQPDAVVLAAAVFARFGGFYQVTDDTGALVAEIGLDQPTPVTPSTGPEISSIEPASGDPLNPPQIIQVAGTGFEEGAEILWDEGPVATTFNDETSLAARLDLLDKEIESGSSVYVQVRNPGGAASNIVTFSFT